MKKVAVIDASALIQGLLEVVEFDQGYIPESVFAEVKCELGRERLERYSYKLEVRNPKEAHIATAQKKAEELGFTGLSKQDLDLAALSLELIEELPTAISSWMGPKDTSIENEVVCITSDGALKHVLLLLGVSLHDGFTADEKKYVQRCYTCQKIYKGSRKIDFCSLCGYGTITKVTCTEDNNGTHLHFKKDFINRPQTITFKGKPIRSSDQKEYKWYRQTKNKEMRQDEKSRRESQKEGEWMV
ncbi:RNA-binding protein NOB1 [Nematocida displodere]|uniref:RNA-binding protein NOB1 n=1 Tax=Nematocida displodere TaxID=1805483 RepID=A0A177EJ57_9MICR|nr:RNA-binding protein NOB1 [Nematocida displodere]